MEVGLKTKWVEALRSGEYEQGKRVLRDYDGAYCVLGVLCEVGGQPVMAGGHSNSEAYAWAKEQLGSHESVRDLWRMNDTYRKSFPELADWIEENL